MIIQSTRVWVEERFQALQIEMQQAKIIRILPYGTKEVDVDYQDKRIIPGMIDIHNHGYNGNDCNRATKQWLQEWVEAMPQDGVTATLATTSSAPTEVMLQGMSEIANFMEESHRGTQILGIYSEGPLISVEFRGAQSEENRVTPSVEAYHQFQNACKGKMIYCGIAPEMDQDLAMIQECVKNGVKVALCHTGATFEQCKAARDAGAISFTHTFNGMRGLHHREPGVVGAALRFDDMYAELIGDGVHVNIDVAHILGMAKGKDKLVLITDAVQIKGLTPGVYDMPGRNVTIGEDGVGRLPNGTLAGSSNRMNVMLGKLINQAELPEVIVINAATCNPAKLCGFGHVKGYITENYDADLAVLNDDYSVAQTYIAGEAML